MGLGLLSLPQELWKFGTQERVVRGTPIALFARVETLAAGALLTTFRKLGATAGYQVTAGKTLLITRFLGVSGTAGGFTSFRYTDNDLGRNNAGPGTNPVRLDSHADGIGGPVAFPTINVTVSFDVYYEIPAGKYFSIEGVVANITIVVIAYGVEV